MKVKYMYLMEMVITQFQQRVDYLTIERGVTNIVKISEFGHKIGAYISGGTPTLTTISD